MSDHERRRLNSLLESVLELPQASRLHYLREECADDQALYDAAIAVLDLEGEAAQWLPDKRQAPQDRDLIGSTIGPYELTELLGQGGMGSVYLGIRRDDELDMKVAVKLLRREVASKAVMDRFRIERQILADLKHPNIAVLHDVGRTDGGEPYLIMEYIDGMDIDQWCDKEALPLEDILALIFKVSGAVAFAHEKGVIHRDIKPANLLVNGAGEPKLLDFGIALQHLEEPSGFAMTPAYAAPEQKEGETVSASCDVYSLGLILLQLLTHKTPRQMEENVHKMVGELMSQGAILHLGEEATPLPEALGHVLRMALAEDPTSRYPNASAFRDAIGRVLSEHHNSNKLFSFEDKDYDVIFWNHPDDQQRVLSIVDQLDSLKIWPITNASSSEKERTIQEGLAHSRVCVICLGDGESPWSHDSSMRDALAFRASEMRLLPVLLAGAAFPEKQSELPSFLRGLSWKRLENQDGSEELTRVIEGIRREDEFTILPGGSCPFRGLEVFREEDRHLFFGREYITQRICEHIQNHSFISILGPSGSGKSSIIRAGVLPWLREKHYAIELMTPSRNPLEALAYVLKESKPDEETTAESLVDWAQSYMGRPEKLCLVIDQFEEVFTLTSDPIERSVFIEGLCRITEQCEDVFILLTMRADFLDQCTLYPALNTLVSDHFLLVPPMNRQELARAIESPCRLANLALEAGLLDQILDDVEGSPGELPLLEHALLELYGRRRGSLLTLAAYAEIGGIEGALAKRAESEYEALDENGRLLLRKIFTMCLIHPGKGARDTRRRAHWDELLAVSKDSSEVEDLLRRWTECRLLTTTRDPHSGIRLAEMAHEALIYKWRRVALWMNEDRDTAHHVLQLRENARTWDKSGREQDYLPQGAPLILLKNLVDKESDNLGNLEKDYVKAGLHREGRKKLGRSLLVATALVVALIFIIALSIHNQKLEAERDVSNKVTEFFMAMFEAADPTKALEQNVPAKTILEQGALRIEDDLKEEKEREVRAKILEGLGSMYSSLGMFHEALPMVGEHLEIRRQEPVDVESLVEALNMAARLQIDLGNYQDSLALGNEALALVEQMGKSPQKATSLQNMATILLRMGKFEESERYFLDAFAMRKDVLGIDDPLTATSLERLGHYYHGMSDYKKALDFYNQALAIREKNLGSKHPDTAASYKNLGSLLKITGDMEQAKRYTSLALDTYRKVYGENHPNTAAGLADLGNVIYRMGQHELARENYERSLEIYKEILGPNHPRTANSMIVLGIYFQQQNDVEMAVDYFQKALEIHKVVLGLDNLVTINNLQNLSTAFYTSRQFGKALPYALQVLELHEKNSGLEHPKTAQSLAIVGVILQAQAKHDQALPYLERAYKIRKETYGESHMLTTFSMITLADGFAVQGNFQQAEKLMDRVMPVLSKNLPPNHWRMLVVESINGLIKVGLGRFDEGLEKILSSHQKQMEISGERDPRMIRSLERIIQAYTIAEKPAEAKPYRELYQSLKMEE